MSAAIISMISCYHEDFMKDIENILRYALQTSKIAKCHLPTVEKRSHNNSLGQLESQMPLTVKNGRVWKKELSCQNIGPSVQIDLRISALVPCLSHIKNFLFIKPQSAHSKLDNSGSIPYLSSQRYDLYHVKDTMNWRMSCFFPRTDTKVLNLAHNQSQCCQ